MFGDATATVILCGMPDEKRVLTNALHPGTLVLSGTDKLNLPALIPTNCTRIVCMGVCGGLSPKLVVPDIALATSVVDHGYDIAQADRDWNAKAVVVGAAHGLTLHPVQYYSSGLFDEADSATRRADMFRRYNADAIDNETRFVVAEAQRRSIPFNVVRPLSDDWRETLPLSATGAVMNKDGTADIEYLLRSLGQDQGQDSVNLFQVARDYGRSLDALEDIARALAVLIASE